MSRVGREHGARTVRVAADEAERALLWKGRKSAFGAIARIAPDYYLHDAVVPRTKLVEVLRQVYAIAAEQRLTMMNVFHAGDGNLHPLIVFDAPRARRVGARARAPATRSSPRASPPAECCRASTASASRSARRCRSSSAPDDLDAQARLRDAFDPSAAPTRSKILPRGQPLR